MKQILMMFLVALLALVASIAAAILTESFLLSWAAASAVLALGAWLLLKHEG